MQINPFKTGSYSPILILTYCYILSKNIFSFIFVLTFMYSLYAYLHHLLYGRFYTYSVRLSRYISLSYELDVSFPFLFTVSYGSPTHWFFILWSFYLDPPSLHIVIKSLLLVSQFDSLFCKTIILYFL